jgi:magnesium-transporting ATPase (P-type)
METIFHQMKVEEVMPYLRSDQNGLTNEEVSKRQGQYGRNTMPQPKSKTLVEIFFHQFLNPLIYVLIAASIISIATGDVKDAIFIAAIILINAILGTYQEWRAENSALALRNLVKVKCRVRRGGRIFEIDSEELVPGDIVFLESGQKVPADLRLLSVNDLSVEEALLTGESVPVNKITDPMLGGADLPIGDRLNMVFAATTIQKGRATAVVATTGLHTQIGRIADSLRTTESEKPPLVRRMEVFSRKISLIILGACVILGVIAYLGGMEIREIFFLMVAVGVSAIPEGLPVGLTVALSIGTRRMAARNVIVRKLPAVEGLGSCTLIASDKTGTLTMDQQSVKKLYLPDQKFYEVTGQGYNGEGEILDRENKAIKMNEHLNRLILACIMANEGILRKTNDVWEHSGDPVDVAFRALAYKVGKIPKFFKDQVKLVKMVPYESENQFSASFFEQNNSLHFVMKGAAEVVMNKLSESERITVTDIAEQMATDGYRVIAVAGGSVASADIADLPELKILGLVGMIDPLRAEAQDAVLECRQAGIEVVMVTGDHPSTALTIAKELGIAAKREEVITGSELSGMDKLTVPELAEKLRNKKVFARVAPLQKQRIVEAKKSLGHFVAVTGDGANDAPALKSAHIGIAMGGGTDLAKEASSIIIADNNFASIAAGVEEGRFTFDNLRKIIYLLISTGAAELLTIGLAIFTQLPLPFLAVQLLWLNLVTNGIQDIALAFEKGDKSVMQKPPRKPEESIFDKLMNSQIIISGVFIAGLVFTLWYHLIYNLNYDETHARTVVMMLMVLLQNFHVLNCRSETKSLFKIPLKNNYVLIGGMLLAQVLHISASYIPGLNTTLQLDHITFSEWIKLVPTAASIVVVMEIFKWIRRRTSTRTDNKTLILK